MVLALSMFSKIKVPLSVKVDDEVYLGSKQ